MANLLTLQEAKDQLRITATTFDVQITRASLGASDEIITYLKAQADPAWDATTAPPRVKTAVGLMLTNRWDNHGEDQQKKDEECWATIARLLARDRDPALA